MSRLEKPDKTALIRAAVRNDLIPWCAQFGFKKGKRPGSGPPQGPTLLRQRDGHLDEILFLWRSGYRPVFMIEFWTDQEERMQPTRPVNPKVLPLYSGRIYPRIRTWRDMFADGSLYDRHPWYGARMSVDEAIDLAKQRIIDLDSYFRTGGPMDLINLS